MRVCAVSVDLDEVPHYHAIHGLDRPSQAASQAVYDVALPRLSELARTHQIPLTLFAIAGDMARTDNAERLRAMAADGHEIANHSLDHHYDLTRRDAAEMRRQIEVAIQVLEAATGQRPSGFRAPGYTVTDALFDVLEECGVDYDSSVFPCPPYWLAKASALAAMRVRRRRSRSILDRPQVLLAPTQPYRVGRPYWRRGAGIVELPIQVTRGARLPFIGTTLTLAGADRARWLTRWVVGEEVVNLELHGIDVLDRADGLAALAPYQPDVRVPVAKKLAALAAVLEDLKKAGYAFERLDQVARLAS